MLEGLFDAWRRGDALRSVAYFAEDGAYKEANGRTVTGRTALAEHFTRFFRDGPAWQLTVDAIVCEAERAAVQYRFAIQRDGAWHESPGCAFVQLRDGLVTEWREYGGAM